MVAGGALYVELTGPALTAGLAPLWRKRSCKSQAFAGEKGITAEGVQEFLWQELFLDSPQSPDNRQSERTARNPDVNHKKPKEAFWINNWYKPAWMDSQIALWDAGMERSPGYVSTWVQGLSRRVALVEQIGTWRKLCESGKVAEAVDALDLLVQRGFHVPCNFFYGVLKSCTVQKDLVLGRHVHALTVTSGYESNAFLANHLICMYASQGSLVEAMQVFSKVSAPDAYMWASIIFAYARHGQPTQAIGLYQQMRESTVKPDNRIFVAVLKACANAGDLAAGKDIHAHIQGSAVKPDIFVQTCLVDMYAKCGSLEDAQRLFDRLAQKNVVTWTAMIAGYAQQGMGQEALCLYCSMEKEGITPPDSVTFVCLLQACASVGLAALQQGKQLHAQIEEQGRHSDVVVGASLVNMYAKCGSLESAQRAFDGLSQKNVVTWNALIMGYVQQGMGEEALTRYSDMQREGITLPDSTTFVCLLQACATVGVAALHQGKELHTQIEERGLHDNTVVQNSLISMYAKCGSLNDARRLFDRLGHRDVVTWTAMIAGYVQQGMGLEALSLYCSMQKESITPPDSVTFVCLLQACGIVAALPLGKQLHAQIEEQGLQGDVGVGPSLVNMYAKCGSLEDAQQVFDSLPKRESVAWRALIAGYARQGDSEVVFDLVDRMRQEGIQPNGITFLSVLSVCSHVGLVDKGRLYFEAMSTIYGISPSIGHYTCLMDLLGRAGHLKEALQLVRTMPFQPDGAVWLTLLGACRKWMNVEIGRQAFEFAIRIDENDAAPYVLMSNIYAGAHMWEEAKEMQVRRLKCGAWKQPGQSWWTDVDGVVHSFVVGDRKHPESQGIYSRLERLVLKMKKQGYVPHLPSSLRDIADYEKEAELCEHSEKLALAYALNKTPEGTTIRIAKNMRVCVDCHTAIAYVSKLERRIIICRDARRFHVYKEGNCSCGDYW